MSVPINQILVVIVVYLVQQVGGHLGGYLGLSEVFYKGVYQSESLLVACTSEFVSETHDSSGLDVDVAEGDGGKIEAF